ncbi:MAG: hypothetical protein KME43_01055 [Myxacorys chilensis ATA2-1-KO14]|jgi:hypothetical protein|nr:hypothetical protein [Myxacorys chilensis ATA2-1-KO14]
MIQPSLKVMLFFDLELGASDRSEFGKASRLLRNNTEGYQNHGSIHSIPHALALKRD